MARVVFLILAISSTLSLTMPQADGQVSSFRRLASNVGAFESDGTRYVAWQLATTGSPVVVLDTRTGKRASFAGCEVGGENEEQGPVASGGRFLVTCTDGISVLNAANGATTLLPNPKGLLGGGWKAIGTRFVEGGAVPQDCHHSAREVKEESHYEGGPRCIVLYDLATASISYRPGRQISDLNRPGAPTVCEALRRKLGADLANAFPRDFAYHDGLLAETVQHGEAPIKRIRLTGCHHHTKLIATAPEPANLTIAGGLLSWDTGHQATVSHEEENIRTGRLWTYQLATGRRHSLPLPLLDTISGTEKQHGALGYSSHAGPTLFWVAATRLVEEGKGGPRLAASAVYAAKL
ncbi:MAG TPA: hypothetical protein VGD00_10665 [Solirubrobacteraceae bacterium]